MATAPQLPSEVLRVIAEQIGQRLSTRAREAIASGQELEIGESFPIWLIGLSSTADPEVALEKGAVHTGYWYHQIRYGGRAREFAKSRPLGPFPDDWRVEEIATSRLPEKVEDAIAFIDQQMTDDASVRMLVIPAYLVHAFWIGSGKSSRIVLIDKPEAVTVPEYRQVYPGIEFLRRLSTQPYVIGVPPERPFAR